MNIRSLNAESLQVAVTGRVVHGDIQQLRDRLSDHQDSIPLHVQIDCDGGEWPAAIEVCRLLRAHPGTVTCRIGRAERAGLILAVAADRVELSPSTVCIVDEPDIYEALPDFDPLIDVWTTMDLEGTLIEMRSVIEQAAQLVADRSGWPLQKVLCLMRSTESYYGEECAALFDRVTVDVVPAPKKKRKKTNAAPTRIHQTEVHDHAR